MAEVPNEQLVNPYRAPATTTSETEGSVCLDSRRERMQEIGEEFALWEKLRLVYNGILVVMSLICVIVRPAWLSRPFMLLGNLVGGAIGANVCYTVGVLASCYLAWMGFRNRTLTLVLFGLGTILAVVFATMVLNPTTF